MLGGAASYTELPYFYTDQYDLGMEYVAHVEPGGYDNLICRADMTKREFIAFSLTGNRVLAGMNVNIWDVIEPIKAIISSGKDIDPVRLADPSCPVDDVGSAQSEGGRVPYR